MRDNTITVNYKNSHYSVSSTILWQWDYGQILKLIGFDLPDNYIVHFANDPLVGDALVQIGNEDGVDIPDELLETGKPIYAWLYQHATDVDGETVYMITINVKQRPRPTDIEPTPAQVDVIDRAIATLNNAVLVTASAEEAAIAAKESAEAAALIVDQAVTSVVRFDIAQTLTPEQQERVQANLGMGFVLNELDSLNTMVLGETMFRESTAELMDNNNSDSYYPKNTSLIGKQFGVDIINTITNEAWYETDPVTGQSVPVDGPGEYGVVDIDLTGAASVSFPVLATNVDPMTAIFVDSDGVVRQQYINYDLPEGSIVSVQLKPGVTTMKLTISRTRTMSDSLFVTVRKTPLIYLDDVIRYSSQDLTGEQQTQARANIKAAEDIDYAAPIIESTDGISISDAQKDKAILIRTDLEGEVIDEPSNSVFPPKILSTAKSIKYTLCGKNLIGKATSRTTGQLTITYDASTGKCTLDGTPTYNVTVGFGVGFTALPAGKYTLSANNSSYKSGLILKATKLGGASIAEVSLGNSMAYKTFETTDAISGISCYVPTGTALNNFVIQPQIEIGELSNYSLPVSKTFTANFPDEALVVTGQEVQWVEHEENGMITMTQEIGDYKTCPGGFVSVDENGDVTLTVTHTFISSYNGETLPDNFVGTDVRTYTAPSYSRVPQTGSQVFYELPTEDWTIYDLGHFDNSAYELNNVLLSTPSNTKLTYIADTKTYIDAHDAEKADIDYVDKILAEHNSYKLIDDYVPSSNTDAGVTFTWTGNSKCVVTGTPSSSSSTPLSDAFASNNDFSHGLINPGGTYYLHFKSTGSKVRVLLQFGSPNSSGSLPKVRDYICTESTYFTIASNEFSISAKLRIPAGVGSVNETVEVGIYTYPPNKNLVRDIKVNNASVVQNGIASITDHVPTGGSTNQWLHKKSNTDYDVEWANLSFVTPETYGAKGDGETDDSAAIQQMLDEAPLNSVCIFTNDYYCGNGLLVERPINVYMYGKCIFPNTLDYAFRVHGGDVAKNTFRLNLVTSNASDTWANRSIIGLDLWACHENTFDVYCESFKTGIRLLAGDSSDNVNCTYNKIFIRRIYNCQYAIYLDGLTGSGNLARGTVAQNTFIGGRIGVQGSSYSWLGEDDTADNCYWAVRSDLNADRTNNCNSFLAVSFEGFGVQSSPYQNRAKVTLDFASCLYLNCRFEGITWVGRTVTGIHPSMIVGGYGIDSILDFTSAGSFITPVKPKIASYGEPVTLQRAGSGNRYLEVKSANDTLVSVLEDKYLYVPQLALLPDGKLYGAVTPANSMKLLFEYWYDDPASSISHMGAGEWRVTNFGHIVTKNRAGTAAYDIQPIYTAKPTFSTIQTGTMAFVDGRPQWYDGAKWVYADGTEAT